MNKLVLRLFGYPPIGNFVVNILKKRILKPFQNSLSKTIEKQEVKFKHKSRMLENTEIGKEMGFRSGKSLLEYPITTYKDYEPFFKNPTERTFMYPLEKYEKMKTSGTSGEEKWFMLPKDQMVKSIFETSLPAMMLATYHDDEISLEYGDTVYVNIFPRPFLGGTMISSISGNSGSIRGFNLVPNLNIPFEEKTKFFINNSDDLDLAVVQASIFVSRIMPEIKEKLSLKGLFCPDTSIAETYFDEISEFVGVSPVTVYTSTETLSCSLPSIQYPLGFFLDWRRGIFEFLPATNDIPDSEDLIGIDEVEVGKVYRVIFTALESELTRYDTSNSFMCIGKGDDVLGIDSPIFKFHSRLEKSISLHNFPIIAEDDIINVFRDNQIPFIEFTARKMEEKGMEYLEIYVETTSSREADSIQEALHRTLCNENGDYRDLVDFYGFVPLRIHLVPKGVFAKYLSTLRANISKVDRINMKDDDFHKLSQLMVEEDR